MFEKWFPKKPKDKYIKKFWKDFFAHADLFLNILQDNDAESDDYMWMESLVRRWLKMCCLDSTVGYDFKFDTRREPPRLMFLHKNDGYLKQVGERLAALYPQELTGKIDFVVAE